jgi:hypothetical protein
MTGWRRTIELALSEEDVARLTAVARSRTEPASRVERARMLRRVRGRWPQMILLFFIMRCTPTNAG